MKADLRERNSVGGRIGFRLNPEQTCGLLSNRIGQLRGFDHGEQLGKVPLPPVVRMGGQKRNGNFGSGDSAASGGRGGNPVTGQRQGSERRLQFIKGNSEIDQRPQGHVAADAPAAVEKQLPHQHSPAFAAARSGQARM